MVSWFSWIADVKTGHKQDHIEVSTSFLNLWQESWCWLECVNAICFVVIKRGDESKTSWVLQQDVSDVDLDSDRSQQVIHKREELGHKLGAIDNHVVKGSVNHN